MKIGGSALLRDWSLPQALKNSPYESRFKLPWLFRLLVFGMIFRIEHWYLYAVQAVPQCANMGSASRALKSSPGAKMRISVWEEKSKE